MSIPVKSAELQSLIEANKAEWPAELVTLAEKASKALWRVENNPPHQNNTMEERGSPAWLADVRALVDFAEAYGAFISKRREQAGY